MFKAFVYHYLFLPYGVFVDIRAANAAPPPPLVTKRRRAATADVEST